MEVRQLSLIEGARAATGTAVIIDVFRAFTTAAFVIANGAETILPVGDVDEALALRRSHPEWRVMGEVHGHKVPGFDYGNSPDEVSGVDFKGRTVIQRTSSGVRAAACRQATSSFTCAGDSMFRRLAERSAIS